MNKLASNHIEITLELFQEGMDAISNKRYKALLKKIVAVAAVIFALIGIYTYYKGASLFYLVCEFIIIALVCVYILVFMPRSARKKNYKSMCQRAGGDTPRRTIDFFSDHLVIYAEAGRNTNVGYDEIAEIAETKNLWVLNCKDQTGVLVDKEGFSLGTFDTVRPVIEKVIAETPKEEKKTTKDIQLNAKSDSTTSDSSDSADASSSAGSEKSGKSAASEDSESSAAPAKPAKPKKLVNSSKPMSLSQIANLSLIADDEADEEETDTEDTADADADDDIADNAVHSDNAEDADHAENSSSAEKERDIAKDSMNEEA